MACAERAVSMCGLRLPSLCDCRYNLIGYADSAAGLASRYVVGNDPEERRQRVWVTTSAGGLKSYETAWA